MVRDLEARPTAALLRTRATRPQRAELHWRIAMPLMCLVLALLAVPLARLRPRQGRYARVWVALLIFLLYSQLISVGKVWIAHGTLPEFLGLWWTHAVVVLLALLVILGPALRQPPALPDARPVSVLDRYIVRTILGSVLHGGRGAAGARRALHLHRPAGGHRQRRLHAPSVRCGTRC